MKTGLNRKLAALLTTAWLTVLSTFLTGCGQASPETSSIDKSMVQVFSSDKEGHEGALISFGLAVGDGSQILTVIDYEYNATDTLYVGLPGKSRYSASIQAVDPLNSVTLLKVKDKLFPPVTITKGANDLSRGTDINLLGWDRTDYKTIKENTTRFLGYSYGLIISEEPDVAYPGAVILKNNNIIGLIGVDYNAFVFRLGPGGATGPVIDIQSAMELFSPDAAKQPWAKGPAYTLEVSKDPNGSQLFSTPPLEKYEQMTTAIIALLDTLGEPLTNAPLHYNFRDYMYGTPEYPLDGKLLGVIYPNPIELRNTEKQIVAEAKWIGIQWTRSENKPNQVLWGDIDENGNAIIEGGFYLLGDISELEKTLQ